MENPAEGRIFRKVIYVEFYSKQDYYTGIAEIPNKFSTFPSTGRVRRPQRLPAATNTLTQYPERYVVPRDPPHNSRRLFETADDVADAPKMDSKTRFFSDLSWVQFLYKILYKCDSGKKWSAGGNP